MGTIKAYRIQAVLARPRNDGKLLAFAQSIAQKVTGNAGLVPAPPALADLSTALPVFAAAIQTATTQKDTASALTAARQAIVDALDHLRDDVQGFAQKQPPDVGKALVESAGMRVKTVTVRAKPVLAATHGSVSGAVVLVARAVARYAVYFWQYSVDQKTWTDCPSTLKAMAAVAGLTPVTVCYFRFRAQTRQGMQDWTPSVSIIVH